MFKRKIFTRNYNEYTGCIHNHTEHSFDSTFPVAKLIKAAEKNNLDYVTINDHMTMDAKADPAFLENHKTMVIVGSEINDPEQQHHYLVFNSNKIIAGETVEKYTETYKKENAVGFVAHPYEERLSKKFEKYEWKTASLLPIDGVEIWNYASEWIGKMIVPLNGLSLFLFPSFFVRKPNKKAVALWEKYLDNGYKISAIGSTDAHHINHHCGFFKVPVLCHNTLFRSLRTNVLLDEKEAFTEKNIVQAIKNGHAYIINYKWGYPYNFYAGICGNVGNGVTFGESIKYTNDLKFYFNLPATAKVKLIRNGKEIIKIMNSKGHFNIEQKGRYRLEIMRFGYGWIYTNYIFVTE